MRAGMKIWFNRWFTTVSHYITMIKNNPDNRSFTIYGTHPDKDALYLQVCDFKGTEPDISGEEYILFCLDFCARNEIDIFIPRKENVLISRNLPRFEAIGVKVLVCPDPVLMSFMDNKAAIYRSIEEKNSAGKQLVNIPDYEVVNTAAGFKEAYHKLRAAGHKVCFKPVIGEGAYGFRVVKDREDSIAELFGQGVGHRISFANACGILSQQESFPDLMVLEYLDGPEYSIDCLADGGKLYTSIPRKKGHGRVRELEENLLLSGIAENLHREYPVPYVFNVQVKYGQGVPKLLEINPRMSGGLHISCLSGINFPYLAIKLLLNEKIDPAPPNFGIRASYLEKEVILS
ncbi:carbamoyl-phosphate synthase large subunit [Bacillus sp. UMB0728]|nr:carbamoyl-phosphate synthase large subunit [Bacillus sp. UMB0728]